MTTLLYGGAVPVKCFLIDDDLDDQEIFGMAVKELSDRIRCYFADDGIKALEKLNTEEFLPHCIFIDINMPRMNGIECLQLIKGISRLKAVPVCMFSTSADPAIIEKAKQLGAIDFIVKPPSIFVLSQLLSRFFNSHLSSP
jgi:CheY-like chemotaxis protein